MQDGSSNGKIGLSKLVRGIGTLLIVGIVATVGVLLARTIDMSHLASINTLMPATRTQTASDAASADATPPREKSVPGNATISSAWRMWQDITMPDPWAPDAYALEGFQPRRVFPAGYEIIDGATLQSEQTFIHLSGIASLPASAICLSDQTTKFACGLQARASLSILVSGEKLVCYPDVSLSAEMPKYICDSRGRDVAQAQIEAGFALPAQTGIPAMDALEAKARAAHLGAWNGDWTIIPPGAAPVPIKNTAR
jgi:endonuclease YncB( thermonuclease family)